MISIRRTGDGFRSGLFRGADLIIYDTGESTEEVHQGSAEIRLFTEEVTQWTVYILWFVKSNLY